MDFEDISKLTPQEQAVINYHRANLIGGNYWKQPGGEITTFYGTIVDTPEGGAVLIPGYWGGRQTLNVPDAMQRAIKSGIDWPRFKNPKDARDAEIRLHDIMERDLDVFRSSKNATR